MFKPSWAILAVVGTAACAAFGCGTLVGADFDNLQAFGADASSVLAIPEAGASSPDAAPTMATCSVDLQSDHDHCGSCNHPCSEAQVCNRGICATGCSLDLAQCGSSCVNLGSNLSHCGSCTNVCVPPANAIATCNEQCGFMCRPGFSVCGGGCCSTTVADASTTDAQSACSADGAACTSGASCCSGACDSLLETCGTAAPTCIATGGTCVNDSDCCTNPSASASGGPSGAYCTAAKTCAACGIGGDLCNSTACCKGATCDGLICE